MVVETVGAEAAVAAAAVVELPTLVVICCLTIRCLRGNRAEAGVATSVEATTRAAAVGVEADAVQVPRILKTVGRLAQQSISVASCCLTIRCLRGNRAEAGLMSTCLIRSWLNWLGEATFV